MFYSQWLNPVIKHGVEFHGAGKTWDLSPSHMETHTQLHLGDRKHLQLSEYEEHHKEHDRDHSHDILPLTSLICSADVLDSCFSLMCCLWSQGDY